MSESDEIAGGDPFADRENRRYDSPVASREHLLELMERERAPLTFEQLVERLDYVDDEPRLEGLRRRLGAMERDGQAIRNRRGGYVPVDRSALLAGRISAHPDGFGFVVTDDDGSDIYLNARQMRAVLHGDRVVVCVTGHDARGRREGRIVDVVERANRSLVGRVIADQGVTLVSPDNRRIHQDILVAAHETAGANHGEMVVVEITEQPGRRRPPVGRIVEVLGEHLEAGMEIDVALRSHDIPFEWPDDVVEQARGLPDKVRADDIGERLDLRDLPLVTIDGADARDFDDAVYCEPADEGWRLLVAIADVAHYVRPDSALDREASGRGTSVYFPGRVVPMLPEALSNGLCSLNPKVDRLCLVCELTLDDEGGLLRFRFHNGVMRSRARLTYGEVHEILSDHKSRLRKKHEALVPHLEELHELYELLAVERRRRGALELETSDTRIVFDDDRKIREIVPVVRNDAHRLIEEFMILANVAAARYLENEELPALYRVHHGPKADRLEDLRAFLALRSLTLGGGDSPTSSDYAAVMREVEERPDGHVIQTMLLRSMQQAVYQPSNDGHFGLALDAYAHFTSPIRRYPDLLVHRAIKARIEASAGAGHVYPPQEMISLGESCSMTERRAEEATRDVVGWLKCEYMQDHIGSEFAGVVSAVTAFGLFVELSGIHVEGLIHVTQLARDYYRFDSAAQALVGDASGRTYRLGDSLQVRVEAVNLDERKIDFAEVEGKGSGRRGARARANGAGDKAPGTQALHESGPVDEVDEVDEFEDWDDTLQPGNRLDEPEPPTAPASKRKSGGRAGKTAARSAGDVAEGGRRTQRKRGRNRSRRERSAPSGERHAAVDTQASGPVDSAGGEPARNGQAAATDGAPRRPRRRRRGKTRTAPAIDGSHASSSDGAEPGNASVESGNRAEPGNGTTARKPAARRSRRRGGASTDARATGQTAARNASAKRGARKGKARTTNGKRRGPKRVGVMDMSRPDRAVKDDWLVGAAPKSAAKVLVKRVRKLVKPDGDATAGVAAESRAPSRTAGTRLALGENAQRRSSRIADTNGKSGGQGANTTGGTRAAARRGRRRNAGDGAHAAQDQGNGNDAVNGSGERGRSKSSARRKRGARATETPGSQSKQESSADR